MPSRDKLKNLRKTMSIKNVADYFGVSEAVISKWIRIYSLYSHECKYSTSTNGVIFTDYQNNILLGSLLGDGSITNGGIRKNFQFEIEQKSENKEYLSWIRDILMPFSCGISERKRRKPKRINGKVIHNQTDTGWSHICKLRTVCHKFFTELREKWYVDAYKKSPKKIPKDLKLNWEMIAVWFCDDGSHRKNRKEIRFATNGFSYEDVCFLKNKLEEIEIKSYLVTRKNENGKEYVLYISCKSYDLFIKNINPHINFECFKYKKEGRKLNYNNMLVLEN